ncbi:MAG TPA: integrase, partial [Chloroflexia bacterium]|nr:integrase [Chloroflexia bacterium]
SRSEMQLSIPKIIQYIGQTLHKKFLSWSKPARNSVVAVAINDLSKSKTELLKENALLRQQLIILKRQVKKPSFTSLDRFKVLPKVKTIK